MRKLLIFMLTIFSVVVLNAQTIDELKRSMEKAQQEINKGNKLLKVNKSKTSSIINDIVITNRNIKNRESIISSGKKHSTLIKNDINSYNDKIDVLSNSLKKEKELYIKMMHSAYKRNLQNYNLSLLLSSSSLQDLHIRIYYLNKYSEMKVNLAKKIGEDSKELNLIVNNLVKKQASLDKSNNKVAAEVKKLADEKKGLNDIHRSLTSENKQLRKKVSEKTQQMKKMKKQIAKIIEEENMAYSKKNRSDKEIILSGEFVKNKGKLPRPVKGGLIVEKFGTHRHPLYPTITVENKGINIALEDNEDIRSIFKGVVVRVFFIQGLNNSIMVRHGDYITVYSGITVVNVQKDDIVDTGDILGKIANAKETPILHFELHKGKVAQNPELWLRK